ncbi:MAG: EpsG family protein [Schaedlerella sp.]|nr:EpsG family protein [Schaedlerella sp.]
MSQYIMVLIWLAIIYLISCIINVYKNEYVFGKKVVRVQRGFVIFAIIPLIWWAATRSGAFFDTNAYMKSFEEMPNMLSGISSHIQNVDKDKGFYILSVLIKTLIGDSVVAYFLILASIQLLMLASVFRKYSSNFVMSLFLFVVTTDYLSWMHNGIRQFTAVTLIFVATELMLKKKYIPLIGIILLASTIHGSALLMIPVIFVVQGEPWNKKTLLAVFAFVMSIVFVDKFTNILDVMLTDTQYTNVVSDWQAGADDGTNPIRVLVYSIPTILSLIGYRYIKAAKDSIIDLACNMGILSTMLYCLSAVTSGIFIGRLPIYCSLYATGILLPWELDNMFTKESSRIIKMLMCAAFIVFYYFQIHFIWGLV